MRTERGVTARIRALVSESILEYIKEELGSMDVYRSSPSFDTEYFTLTCREEVMYSFFILSLQFPVTMLSMDNHSYARMTSFLYAVVD